MAVIIVNKWHKPGSDDYVWCGRPSPVGNPWPVANTTEAERDRVCDLYESWFHEQMKTPTPAAHFVLDLINKAVTEGNVNLGCVCKQPKKEVRCHCDTIKTFMDTQILKRKKKGIEI